MRLGPLGEISLCSAPFMIRDTHFKVVMNFMKGFFNMQACQMIGGESREYACQNPWGSLRVNPQK